MAIVTNLSEVTKDKPGKPKTTAAAYCTVEIDGTAYLLVESYGSPERLKKHKVSQSFHFDRAHAAQLKAVLESTFPGI